VTAVVTGFGIIGPGFSNSCQFTEVLINKRFVLNQEEVSGKMLYLGRVEDKEIKIHHLFPQAHILPKAAQMLLHATEEAMNMSRISTKDFRTGIIIGSSGGVISEVLHHSKSSRKRSSYLIGNMNDYSLASVICSAFELNGMSFNLSNSCTSSLDALHLAKVLIETKQLDRCIVGGADSTLNDLIIEGFSHLRVLQQKDNPTGPFSDKGFAMSEGAGALILERKEIAMERGAEIFGEIPESCISQDAISPYKSDASGVQLSIAVEHCISNGLPTYINSQGLGIKQNDQIEASIYKKLFKPYGIPLTSIKGMIGHQMGASGMFQVISSLISIRDHFIPPTFMVEQGLYPELLINTNTTLKKVNSVLITSQGYGGINNCTVIGRGNL
jgi:3-oxoacyl-[acyl-carrier-protein] synthase II